MQSHDTSDVKHAFASRFIIIHSFHRALLPNIIPEPVSHGKLFSRSICFGQYCVRHWQALGLKGKKKALLNKGLFYRW